MDGNFWNTELETLSADELRRYEAPLLTQQIEYLYTHSEYYRAQFDNAGLKPSDVTCHEALEQVPFTEKKDLAQTQREGALIGPHQCAPSSDIVRMVGTGGTSGKPMRIGWTRNDIHAYNEMGTRALWILGCRPGDLVLNCFNYSIYAGGVMDHMSFEHLGATVMAYGVGKSRALLDMFADIPGDKCLYSTPSYAVRLAEVAAEAGIDPLSLNIKKGFFSGEAGLQVPGYRQKIEKTWGMSTHDLYGIAELGCQSAECEHHDGMHFCGQGYVIAELIDPDTGAVKPMRDGEKGELVYTSIRRQASPLLRLRSHDYVQVKTSPCACGRTGFRFLTEGRSDDMFVVKGVNIFPTTVQDVLHDLEPRLTGEFQIALNSPPPFDYAPRLIVEVSNNVPRSQYEALINETEALVSRRAAFAVRVELVQQGTIASEHKTKRVLRNYEA
ncbi:phenylacetate--CoA ligase family protein [Cochlodiniinecator piscidefendens]|uniref:phenylacetate--CoA ligase family protein n=1 Tax=Cochlodiniinecator piscidefendens TaxID=2715756 RepID=UPI00140B61B2|nr:phenylacetate--CoA ligase [Cochlodiniinecator piscidefendens]